MAGDEIRSAEGDRLTRVGLEGDRRRRRSRRRDGQLLVEGAGAHVDEGARRRRRRGLGERRVGRAGPPCTCGSEPRRWSRRRLRWSGRRTPFARTATDRAGPEKTGSGPSPAPILRSRRSRAAPPRSPSPRHRARRPPEPAIPAPPWEEDCPALPPSQPAVDKTPAVAARQVPLRMTRPSSPWIWARFRMSRSIDE